MRPIPCPTPGCGHAFAGDAELKASAVKCPKCGREFRLKRPEGPATSTKPRGPGKPLAVRPPVGRPALPLKSTPPARPARPAGAPTSVPTPAAPLEVPAEAPIPPPTPAGPGWPAPIASPMNPYGYPPPGAIPYSPVPPGAKGAAVAAPSKPGGSIVKVRNRRRFRHPVLKGVIVTVVAGMVLAAVGYVVKTWGPLINADPIGLSSAGGYIYHIRNQLGADERVLTLPIDKAVWEPDKDRRTTMKATAAFKRIDNAGDAWFAVAVQDFGAQKPREGELLNSAIDRLKSLFGETLEIDKKLEPGRLGGVDGWRCQFKGKLNVVVWWGECYLIPHRGLGYLVFVAAPTPDEVAAQVAEFEAGQAIRLTTPEREGWRPQPPPLDEFLSLDEVFTLKTPERIWRENDPRTEDEAGVMYLSGHFQSLFPNIQDYVVSKNATLVAVALDKRPDVREAFKEVVAYLRKKKQEESKDYDFAPLGDGGADGEPQNVGLFPGVVGELRLLRGKDTMRYVLVAAFNEGPKTYGLRFECAWDFKEVWRQEFRDIVATVRPVKK